jgi:hypothetical protein
MATLFIETKLNELRDRLAKTQVSPGGKRTIDEGMKRKIVGIMVKFINGLISKMTVLATSLTPRRTSQVLSRRSLLAALSSYL